MHDLALYMVGGFLGLVMLKLAASKDGDGAYVLRATPRHPGATLPPTLAAPPRTANLASLLPPHAAVRGLPSHLLDAMAHAPDVPLPALAAESPDDKVALHLAPEHTAALAAKAVDKINAAKVGGPGGPGGLRLVLIHAERATRMVSGATRVFFTAHETAHNVAVKLVASFDVHDTLIFVRPFSILPDLPPTDAPGATPAAFVPL